MDGDSQSDSSEVEDPGVSGSVSSSSPSDESEAWRWLIVSRKATGALNRGEDAVVTPPTAETDDSGAAEGTATFQS